MENIYKYKEGTFRSVLLATYVDDSGSNIHIRSDNFRKRTDNGMDIDYTKKQKCIITKQDIFQYAAMGRGFKTLHYSPLFNDGPIRIWTPNEE